LEMPPNGFRHNGVAAGSQSQPRLAGVDRPDARPDAQATRLLRRPYRGAWKHPEDVAG
jgi:hypothetical protein